ncbi:MAG: integrase core domain-containing protein [bacterium]|nr:integrase core domain-containing protein [bacterium]
MAYMPYTMNPHLPRLRKEAADLVLREGWSSRDVARHYRFNQSTIVRWVGKARMTNRNVIATESSRPHHHPRELSGELVSAILAYRRERNQCAEILHHRLMTDGYPVSLSSVKRVLRRHGISRFSRWKKWHQYPPRPLPETPGVLVEIDTIHDGPHDSRLYVYTLLDVCSRWAYAWASERITTYRSLRFVRAAAETVPFAIRTLQSDHGPEFSKWFTTQIEHDGMAHRHSRVRQPNDNAHLERFNRTIQDECLSRLARTIPSYQRGIAEYLRYYNTERPHMGLEFKTPTEVMRSY